jgi:2,4-dienoyl-CoA reductase [(3E)-enoyl-CoA-producing], peroxisomal
LVQMQPPTSSVFRPNLLQGRVALITGGGTGIGFGIATELVSCGAAVAIASRNRDHVGPAVQRLHEIGGHAFAVEVNVRDRDSVDRMVEQTCAEFGGFDILVNNAAGNFYVPSASMSPNAWRAVLETDLSGTFFGCQAAYPVLRARGGGRIISISMTLHYRGWPMMAHATAAKAGIDALTRTLAVEWAPDNITVNAIAPGPILTEGVRKAFTPPEGQHDNAVPIDERLRQQIPLHRLGTPEDIAHMAAYLSSAAGSWITGAIFVVDGGSWLSKV